MKLIRIRHYSYVTITRWNEFKLRNNHSSCDSIAGALGIRKIKVTLQYLLESILSAVTLQQFFQIIFVIKKGVHFSSTGDFQSKVGEVFGDIGGELPAKFGRRFSRFVCGENRQKHFPPKLHRKFHHQTSLRGSGLWRALHFSRESGPNSEENGIHMNTS